MTTIAPSCIGTAGNGFMELVSGVVDGANKIKNDLDTLCNGLSLISTITALKHVSNSSVRHFNKMADNSIGVIDCVRLPFNLVFELPESIAKCFDSKQKMSERACNILDCFSHISFTLSTALSSAVWLGARGVPHLARLANSAGASFQVFGTPLLVTVGSCISGLVAAGFFFQAIHAGYDIANVLISREPDKWKDSEIAIVIHRSLKIARCVAQIAASILFVAATATACVSGAMPFILTLGVIALSLAVVEFLYRKGREKPLGLE